MRAPYRDSVPMSAVSPLITEWLNSDPNSVTGRKDSIDGRTFELLSERSGVPARRIHAIMSGFQQNGRYGGAYETISFGTADKLLCAMDMVYRWQTDLSEHYGPISVLPYEYEFEQPETDAPCGTFESFDGGCKCHPCRKSHGRRMRREPERMEYQRQYKRKARHTVSPPPKEAL